MRPSSGATRCPSPALGDPIPSPPRSEFPSPLPSLKPFHDFSSLGIKAKGLSLGSLLSFHHSFIHLFTSILQCLHCTRPTAEWCWGSSSDGDGPGPRASQASRDPAVASVSDDRVGKAGMEEFRVLWEPRGGSSPSPGDTKGASWRRGF